MMCLKTKYKTNISGFLPYIKNLEKLLKRVNVLNPYVNQYTAENLFFGVAFSAKKCHYEMIVGANHK